MRVFRLALFVVLVAALPLFAREVPTITSISPSSLHQMSGEWFMTIEGAHYLPLGGMSIIFSGPGGTYTIGPSSGTDTHVFVWIPLNVLNVPGSYSVKIRVPNGAGTLDSNALTLDVIGSTVVLKIPQIVLAEATSLQGAIANFEVTAESAYGQDTYIDCSHKSGELFPFDVTTVDCVATDDFGGAARGSFSIQVADTTPPSIDVPRDLVVFGNSDGAVAKWDAKATDVVDPEVTVSCAPETGSFFRIGTSGVSCTSFDRFKNQGVVNFRVHAGNDTTPALIVPETVLADAASIDGAEVKYDVSATDVKGGTVGVECDPKPGSLFPLGTTTVKCVALSATELFDVKVADLTPPALFLPREVTAQAVVWDGAIVNYDAYAKDAVDGGADVSCYPASGTLFAPGTTTVTCTTSDKARNQANGNFVVTVLSPIDDTEYLRRTVSTDQ